MKQLILVFSILLTIALSAQEKDSLSQAEKERREQNIQAGNPFKKYGYTPKIATLSKGKYLEWHDLDSIVIIGSVYFNTKTKKVIDFVERDMTNPDAQPLSDIRGRWLSPDPLAEEFPDWSPYNFVYNNPLRFSDPTGMAGEDFIDINKKTGQITVTPAEGNDQVRLIGEDGKVEASYEYGENGSFTKENNITFEDGQKINKELGTFVEFGDYDKARTFFEFASQADVEFGFVDFFFSNNMTGMSTVMTSHLESTVYLGSYVNSVMKDNPSAFVLEYAHSHPGMLLPTLHPAYPSGFDWQLKPTSSKRGDRSNYINMKAKYGDRFPDSAEVYVPAAPGINVKYDGKKVTRTFNK